jgi:hypothetical protein
MWPDDLLDEIQRTVLLHPDLFCLFPIVRDGVVVPCGVLLSRKGWCSVHRRSNSTWKEYYLDFWLKEPEREQARMQAIMVSAGQIADALSKRYQIDVDTGWVASLLVEYGLDPKQTH